MHTSESINEIAAALAKAQGQVRNAIKGVDNTYFKSKYADLGAVWDACRKPLSDNGLSVLQDPSTAFTPDGQAVVSVETVLMHTSGQWIRGTLTVASKDASPQAVGSCITYMKRYQLQSYAGVGTEDDDAEAGQGRGAIPAAAKAKPAEPPAGFDDWLLDMQAVVQEGTARLAQAWESSRIELRKHLTATAPKKWEDMKAAAAKVNVAVPA